MQVCIPGPSMYLHHADILLHTRYSSMGSSRANAGLNSPTVSDVSSHGILDPSDEWDFAEGNLSLCCDKKENFSLCCTRKRIIILYLVHEREFSSLCCTRKRIIPDIYKGIPINNRTGNHGTFKKGLNNLVQFGG